MHHARGSEFDDEQHVDRPKEQVDHGQEVTGPSFLCAILQEPVPILGRRSRRPNAAQVGVDRIFRHVQAEFEQFAADPLGAKSDSQEPSVGSV